MPLYNSWCCDSVAGNSATWKKTVKLYVKGWKYGHLRETIIMAKINLWARWWPGFCKVIYLSNYNTTSQLWPSWYLGLSDNIRKDTPWSDGKDLISGINCWPLSVYAHCPCLNGQCPSMIVLRWVLGRLGSVSRTVKCHCHLNYANTDVVRCYWI